jgi:glycosyltransferase involved in cell wall biosynthesis
MEGNSPGESDRVDVTIIALSYNHARYLENSLRSVFAQAPLAPTVEIIAIDDASTDGSAALLERIALESPIRITVICNARNVGICQNLNAAFALSRGEYVRTLALDDACPEGSIEAQWRAAKRLSADVLLSDHETMDESGSPTGVVVGNVPPDPLVDLLCYEWIPFAGAMLIRRAVVEALGGWDETLRFEDRDFSARMLASHTMSYSPGVVYAYRVHTAGFHNRLHEVADDYFRIIERHRAHPRIVAGGALLWRRIRARTHLRLSTVFASAHDDRRAPSEAWAATMADPTDLRSGRQLLRLLVPRRLRASLRSARAAVRESRIPFFSRAGRSS